jgi:hypothetical protein
MNSFKLFSGAIGMSKNDGQVFARSKCSKSNDAQISWFKSGSALNGLAK